ncbi:MAG: type II toxin-antitoxin system VapC family toxin [Chloroflexota bacterium]
MDILLDTHSFLWFIEGDKRMSNTAQELIADDENDVFLSIASLWEIAIKANLGKLTLAKPFDKLIPEQLRDNSIQLVNISLDDLNEQVILERHHRDPFDRSIIAQAISKNLPIVSRDPEFKKYDVRILW